MEGRDRKPKMTLFADQDIRKMMKDNYEWLEWHKNVLVKRNALENVCQWACGRPTGLHDRTRDSDEEDIRDRDYDVAALATNLSEAFRYGLYNNDDIEEQAHGSLERDDEDVYFDDESAEVVISSLRLGDDQDSGSLFTNSNWLAFEDDRVVNERSPGLLASPSLNAEETGPVGSSSDDGVIVGEDDDLVDTATSPKVPEQPGSYPGELGTGVSDHGLVEVLKEDSRMSNPSEGGKAPEWVEWRETSDSSDPSEVDQSPALPNGELKEAEDRAHGEVNTDLAEPFPLAGHVVANGAKESPSSQQAESE